MMTSFHAPISEQIWKQKYQFKDAEKNPIDHTVEDTWQRVAVALSKPDHTSEKAAAIVYEDFYSALEDFKFLPAGRITAGAGTGREVTLFNCFVMGTVPDSLDGIFDMLKEAAQTMQQGGGIGYDFSTLRPKGSLVRGVAADASGPLTFMDVWDTMCKTIMSAGARRGAMMATMRCDHPDIMDFITAKADATRLRNFNVSVLVTDGFMQAVEDNDDWDLVFNGDYSHSIRARDLWDAIIRNTYDQAEPGVIFIDRINDTNNLRYCETIAATNPCGEQPLPPYGACLLGSLNLVKFVRNPFMSDVSFDHDLLQKTVRSAVRMMDNVVDVSKFPLDAQRDEAKAKRRIGLGVTGVADMLAMMGQVYGTEKAADLMENILHQIQVFAYDASADLAIEKGPFPLFDAKKFLEPGTHASTLPVWLRDKIAATGIRNSHLTSIAPTGTISLYAGNVSSGIEPMFAFSYERKVRNNDETKRVERVEDYAVKLYREHWFKNLSRTDKRYIGKQWSEDYLPDYFVNAQTLRPEAHLVMQAAAQKYVDSSISKTINVPEDISFEDFKEVYQIAYDTGCKGCTTYRPNDVTGSVLSVDKPKEAEAPVIDHTAPKKRPEELDGTTYKLKFGDDRHALYITITDLEEDGVIRPFEIFINSKNPDHYVWTMALTRMISAVFRVSTDATFVVEELKEVFDPKGGAFHKGAFVPSVIAAIGGVIEQHMQSINYIETGDLFDDADTVSALESGPVKAPAACPKCGGFNMVKQAGCETCGDCGHSKCG